MDVNATEEQLLQHPPSEVTTRSTSGELHDAALVAQAQQHTDRSLDHLRFLQSVTNDVLDCDADAFRLRCRALTQQLEEKRREYDGGALLIPCAKRRDSTPPLCHTHWDVYGRALAIFFINSLHPQPSAAAGIAAGMFRKDARRPDVSLARVFLLVCAVASRLTASGGRRDGAQRPRRCCCDCCSSSRAARAWSRRRRCTRTS